jgi:DNA modification methylase
VLKPTGSLFLNLGDTYYKRTLVGIPGLIESAARADGWLLRNRVIWAKPAGLPSPHKNRLANRHEVVLHLTRDRSYFYDLDGLCEHLGRASNG